MRGVIGVDLDSPHANVHADICKLPYENNSVDCVLAFGSLVFGDREERTLLDGEQLLLEQLQEIFRVLKPSGMFYGRSRYLTVINNSSLTSYEQLFGATRLCSKIIKHTTKNEERIYWEWKKI